MPRRFCGSNAPFTDEPGFHKIREGSVSEKHAIQYTEADLDRCATADAGSIAGHVRLLGYRVKASDVDLLGDLDRVIDLNSVSLQSTSSTVAAAGPIS